MAMLVWVMVGLALWHFTVFLPDHFYGGIVGAFCGALLGSIIFGTLVNLGVPGESDTNFLTGLQAVPGALLGSIIFGTLVNLGVPGESDTNFLTGLEAVPGALLGMGLMWWLGIRQLRSEERVAGAH